MGVLYTVLPLEAELVAYLKSQGISAPNGLSRNPTPKEVRASVEGISGINPKIVDGSDGLLRQVLLTSIDPDTGPWTILNVRKNSGEDRPCEIWFEKGWPELIIEVLVRLTQQCGVLVLIADAGGDPLLIHPHQKASELLESWQ